MRLIQAAVLADGLLSLAAFTANAAPLPPTQLELGAHGALGADQVADQFGALESLFNGGGARTTAVSDAGERLRASVWRNAGAAAGESVAYAHERYWFEIQGADGTVPIDLAGQGRVSVEGPLAMGGGVGSTVMVGDASGGLVVSGCAGGYQLAPCNRSSSLEGPYAFSGSFDLQANTHYYVDLWTYSFLPPGQGSTSDVAWASASMALPAFAPDYSSAGAYTFTYASPVPEPEQWALAAAGLGVLALTRRRQRRFARLH